MLSKEQATALVDALTAAGISCLLHAEARSGGSAVYEIGIRFNRMDFARLEELLGILKLYPDVQLLLTDGRFTVS